MRRRAMLLWWVILVLGSGSVLVACGHKGPLYLPDHQEQKGQTAPQAPR